MKKSIEGIALFQYNEKGDIMEFEFEEEYRKECESIEENEICPYCGKKALVHCADYDYYFACTACGHRFEFDGEYMEELAYYLASKQ